MRSTADIKRVADRRRSDYADRDTYYENNYHAYRGEYNLLGSDYANDPLTDFRRSAGDHVQVWNLVPSVVDVHRTLINRLPQIDVPSEAAGEELADQQAEKREKILYVTWDASQMIRKHGEASFNLSLYNSTVWFVRWDPEIDMPLITTRMPGTCYPGFKRQGEVVRDCIFYWEEEADSVWENYPEARSILGREEAQSRGKIPVMEYVDEDSYGIIIADKYKSLVSSDLPKSTKLDFCPVLVVPASFVPGDPFPPGPVHQLVAINDHLNRFQTKWGDSLEQVMWPINWIRGDGADSVVWDKTPNAMNRLPEGVDVGQIPPPSLPTEIFVHIERMEQLMRRIAGVSETAYGESPGSIVTGKAIGRLQGIMTGMAAETQANMAMGLQELNKMILKMYCAYRPKKKYALRSNSPGTALSSPGRKTQFAVSFVPEEDIEGWYDNQLYYSPFGADFGTGIQLAMQLVASDLAPEQWVMDQVPGIGDSSAMMKQIEENKRRKMSLEIDLQTEAQMKLMQAQTQQQQQLAQMQQGQSPAGGAAPEGGAAPAGGEAGPPPGGPGPGPGGPPPGGLANTLVMPAGQPQAMGTGEPFVGEEQFPLPFQNVQPYSAGLEAVAGAQGGAPAPTGLQAEAAPGLTMVSADEVVSTLQAAVNRKGEPAMSKLKGEVFLVGEIAERGWTDGPIEIALTVKTDQQIVTTALPQWASQNKLKFRVVAPGQTPDGAIPVKGGGEVDVS